MTAIEISEVGPRDGLQLIERVMPTEIKKAWISAEAAAGVPEIEVTSLVPPTRFPQFADAREVISHALSIDGLTVGVLTPNFKGAERVLDMGVHKITLTVSVSESHSLANVRKTPDQQVDECRKIAELLSLESAERRPVLSVGLSTAFGCSIEGPIRESEVCRLAEAVIAAGADDVGLSDTVGYANPAQVRRLYRQVRDIVGDRLSGIHIHNTRGLGLANALAAFDVGATTFDSSLGGLGGCPFAPGASGNLVTEDLVFMFEAMGIDTGIDLDRLFAVRQVVQECLIGDELHGLTPLAGLPKGFRQLD